MWVCCEVITSYKKAATGIFRVNEQVESSFIHHGLRIFLSQRSVNGVRRESISDCSKTDAFIS